MTQLPPLSLSSANQPISGAEAAVQGADDVIQEVLGQISSDTTTGDVQASTGPTMIGGGGDDNWMQEALSAVSQMPSAPTAPSIVPSAAASPLVTYGVPLALLAVGAFVVYRYTRKD
ncbi:MAG: hypothetical protein AAGF27_06725 [Pseudomonadota bacterium]